MGICGGAIFHKSNGDVKRAPVAQFIPAIGMAGAIEEFFELVT